MWLGRKGGEGFDKFMWNGTRRSRGADFLERRVDVASKINVWGY